MAPDDKESLIIGQRSLNANVEKPFQVSLHPPQVTNRSWPIFGIQKAKIVDVIAPESPKLYFTVKSHERSTWIAREKTDKYVMIMFLLCAWRNIWQVYDAMKEYTTGFNQRAIVPATSAIDSSWPNAFRIGVVKTKTGTITVVVMHKTIHDL